MPVKQTQGAVLYSRVSTGEQAESGTSLASQRDACRAKALSLGLPIIAEYEDAGISGGFLLSRPGMQAALADMAAGRASTLICANLSRYSRDVEHQQAVKKAVRAAQGRLVFCDMDFDDTPEGDLAFGIMGNFAEYEKKVIRDRTIKGRRKRAEEGQQPTRTRSPFGYHIVTKADVLRGLFPSDQLGKHQIVPEEAVYVRELFARYASGAHSLNSLAKWLNQSGVTTKNKGVFWRAGALRGILRNTAYKGEAVFGRTAWHMDEKRLAEIDPRTGKFFRCAHVQVFTSPEDWIKIDCPPLVSDQLWEESQTRLAKNQREQGGNPHRIRMLSGLVVCESCGRPMNVDVASKSVRGERTQYTPDQYRCGHETRAFAATGIHACSTTHFMLKVVEEAVVQALGEMCAQPEIVRCALEEYSRQAKPVLSLDTLRAELAAADKAIQSLIQEETAAVQAQIAGIRAGASPDAYAEVFAHVAARRKDLEDARGRLSAQIAPSRAAKSTAASLDPEAMKTQVLTDIHRVLTSPLVEGSEKRSLVRTVIEKVVCQKDGADVLFRSGVGVGDTLQLINIKGVACAHVEELAKVKGIGPAKAAEIKAAIEFGSRLSLFTDDARPTIGGPRDVANLLMPDLRYLKKETLKAILLSTKNHVLAIKTISVGDLSSSIVHPREVFQDAVIASAAAIIVAHNHPSGDPTPSAEDVAVTKRLIHAGEILGIDLLDHIVIGDGVFASLKERGLI